MILQVHVRFGITRWPQLLFMSHHPLFGIDLWMELLKPCCCDVTLAISSGCADPTEKTLLCQSVFIQFAPCKSCWRYFRNNCTVLSDLQWIEFVIRNLSDNTICLFFLIAPTDISECADAVCQTSVKTC